MGNWDHEAQFGHALDSGSQVEVGMECAAEGEGEVAADVVASQTAS